MRASWLPLPAATVRVPLETVRVAPDSTVIVLIVSALTLAALEVNVGSLGVPEGM